MMSAEDALHQAERLRMAGRPDDAARFCRLAVALAPGHPLPLYRLARLAWPPGRSAPPETTDGLLRRALVLAPGFVQAALDRSWIFQAQGRHAAAVAVLGDAMRYDRDDDRLPRALGPPLLALGWPGRAEAALRRAAALAPESTEAHFELGTLRHREHRLAEAAACFGRAARLSPEVAQTHLNHGSALFDCSRWQEAGAALRRAVALKPDHGYALFQRARALRRQGRSADALWLMRASLRLEPPRPDFEAEAAALHHDLEHWAAVRRHGRRALALDPGLCAGLLACGVAEERQPSAAVAPLALYDRAMRCGPGFGEPFTRHALWLLARRWGAPPAPRPATARAGRRLASTTLGINGRFGNQLLQYGFLRMYAAEHDLDLETPHWIGRYLYDLDDPLPGPPLLSLSEEEHDFAASLNREVPAVHAGRNLVGFFCYHTGRLARFAPLFRSLFRPGTRLRPHADAVATGLRALGNTTVALHLRRGDFGWGRFWIAPVHWYLHWLQTIWAGLDRPVLYIATDAPELVSEFAAYRPVTAADLGVPIPGIEFFTDFHILCSADIVAISNSTFSFAATMLNEPAPGGSDRRFFRPDRAAGGLVAYDPWGSEVLL